MKRVYEVCETEAEAIKLVNHLMQPEIGYSAYRQGTTVYVDDGGIDDGYDDEEFDDYDDYDDYDDEDSDAEDDYETMDPEDFIKKYL